MKCPWCKSWDTLKSNNIYICICGRAWYIWGDTVKDKPYNNNTWTQARFNSFIKGALRQISFRWPPKHQVKKEAWRARGIYLCAGYKRRKHKVSLSVNEKGKRKNNVFVDHITPIVDPAIGFVDWNQTIKRMFCEADGLQVLCGPCHSLKTKDERDATKKEST